MLNPCDALGRRKPRALMLRRPRRGRLEARGQRGAARERSGRRLASAPKGPRSQDDPTPDGKVRANKDRSRDAHAPMRFFFTLSAKRGRGVPASCIASRRKSAAGNSALVRSSATLVELHRPPPLAPPRRQSPSKDGRLQTPYGGGREGAAPFGITGRQYDILGREPPPSPAKSAVADFAILKAQIGNARFALGRD
jgi:hypothetical protein